MKFLWSGWVLLGAALLGRLCHSAHQAGIRAFLAPMPIQKSHHRIYSPMESLKFTKQRQHYISPYSEKRRHIISLGSDAGASDEPPDSLAGIDDIIDDTQLFSDNALELTMEDMAARELDFEEYKNRSMGHLRKFAIFAASVVTVGLVYTCMNLLKGALNQQHEKIVADRYDGSNPPGEGQLRGNWS